MANYVLTTLDFVGSDKDIQKIKSLVYSKDNKFDFRNIIPYPTERACPAKYLLRKINGEYDYQSAGITPEESAPYLNWYDWQRENWGTKWGACDVEDWNGNSIKFSTAWSFCRPIVQKLSLMFPTITIKFVYADEDLGCNCGRGACINGDITFDKLTEMQAMSLAIEQWGQEDFWTIVDGKWEYKEE